MSKPKEDPDRTQLRQDTIDVFVLRSRLITDFPTERQQLICDYYRFMAHRYESDEPYVAPRTHDTLDVI